MLLLMACSQSPSDPADAQAETDIPAMEEALKASGPNGNDSLALTLAEAYTQFAKQHPQDTLTPHYLYKSGTLLQAIPGKQQEAIFAFRQVQSRYPKHPRAALATFMTGFTFDQWGDHAQEAAESYRAFYTQWPDHPLAEQAKQLETLAGQNLNDVIEQWEKNK
jgi:outer membrane protein assembly factor BamD (BamD/ComL family)